MDHISTFFIVRVVKNEINYEDSMDHISTFFIFRVVKNEINYEDSMDHISTFLYSEFSTALGCSLKTIVLSDYLIARGDTWPTNIRRRVAGKSKKLPCPGVEFPKMIPCHLVSLDKVVLCKEICTKSIENCGNISIRAI